MQFYLDNLSCWNFVAFEDIHYFRYYKHENTENQQQIYIQFAYFYDMQMLGGLFLVIKKYDLIIFTLLLLFTIFKFKL